MLIYVSSRRFLVVRSYAKQGPKYVIGEENIYYGKITLLASPYGKKLP